MPFDPNLPQAGTEIDAVQMRSQLNGLKDLIDEILTVTAAQIDGVNTVNPGDPGSVGLTVIGNTLHFTFDIPRGQEGQEGQAGPTGSDGPQGPPGEVTNVALAGAINGTSNNSNTVATLGLVVSDPPTQTEMQSLANKMDELLVALRR